MQTKSDTELLRDYATNRSEAAFGEIVRRYTDFVYSAALRQTGDAEQARDIAQTVFVDLARKAGSLRTNTVLIGWLCQGARLAALEQLRKDQRRLHRERQVMELLDNPSDALNDWQVVRPALDEAIASLGHEDRDALLLRFFKNESLASVGTTLGVSEDAAQKRVARALEKLRGFLAQRGITTTAAALAAVLAANAVKAAPSGFAASLTTGALAKAGAAGGSAASALKLLGLGNLKTAALILALTGGLATLTMMHLKAQRELRDARARVQQQANDLDALRAARDQLESQSNELERLRRDAQDALRLRGDVARLRREIAALPARVADSVETNRSDGAPPIQVNIKARFISLPSGSGVSSPSGSGASGIWTEPQLRDFLQSMSETNHIAFLSESQVTTLSGREAQVRSVSNEGTTNEQGFTVSVLAMCATNSPLIRLTFASSTVGPVRLPPEEAPPGTSGSVIVRETRGQSALPADAEPVDVFDGQTLVVSRAISGREKWLGGDEPEPRQLLILLTPTIIDAVGNRSFSEEEIKSYQDSVAAPAAFPGAIPEKVLSTNELRANAASTFPQPAVSPAGGQ